MQKHYYDKQARIIEWQNSSYFDASKLAQFFCNVAYFRCDLINIKLQAPELKSSHEKWKTLILCCRQVIVQISMLSLQKHTGNFFENIDNITLSQMSYLSLWKPCQHISLWQVFIST